MPFKKGREKTGGRKKGVQNKKTTETRELIQKILTDGGNRFVEELAAMDGRDYIHTYLKLIEYSVPKLQRKTIETPNQRPPVVIHFDPPPNTMISDPIE